MEVLIPVGILFVFFVSGLRIVMEYERGVVFRFGRYATTKGPGLNWIIPFIDKMAKIGMRTIAFDVPAQDIITKDNVSVKVNAVVYFRVVDPQRAIIQVENYLYATSQLAQTTLRSVLGQHDLDQLLSERDKINKELQDILDHQTDPWGIKVSTVEIKHIDLPVEMQRAMAKQAEAEREFQAAAKLAEASEIISQNPATLQLRYLQTLTEIAVENNSTTIFPIPIELFNAFVKAQKE